MNAYSIKIECEEDGFHIIIDGDSIDPEYQAGEYGWRIEDSALEAFYDQVKARIGPYLREMHEARDAVARGVTLEEFRNLPDIPLSPFVCAPADVDESGGMTEYAVAVREDGSLRMERDEDAYDPADPKHPAFHSTHADIWDARDGK